MRGQRRPGVQLVRIEECAAVADTDAVSSSPPRSADDAPAPDAALRAFATHPLVGSLDAARALAVAAVAGGAP